MDQFRKQYLDGHYLYAPGHNYKTIRNIFKDTYSNIEITIKERYGSEILENWHIHTCKSTYTCEKCKKGGILIEELIFRAEVNKGKLIDRLEFCEKCSNGWDIDVTLTKK